MEFRILGRAELWAEGKRHDLGTRKERCVLAVLLCELPHPVPAETLVGRIWGGDPPDSAYNSLYSVTSRLRKRLGDVSGTDGEQLLPKRSGSYTLNVRRDDVDMWRFRVLRDQARAAFGHGDDEMVVNLLYEADALWRGIPLDGLDGDWAEGVREGLYEERLAAAVQRIRAGLRLSRHADLVGEITELARQYPSNELLLELYLRALYGSGRQPDALAAYLQAEHRWRDEYGVDLGPALRDLHRLMLREDPTLNATLPLRESTAAQAASTAPPPSTMPRDNPDFTARTVELEKLTSWLDTEVARSSVPVVVISGMAGVGKTALAVHAAHLLRERHTEQAQVFVSLGAHNPGEEPVAPADALGALLRRMGVPDTVIPADKEDRAALLRFKLAGRSTCILLDDALNTSQVLPLLPGVPGCVVLITTRRRALDVPGMLPIQLNPMSYEDAAALFTRTAGGDQAADRASVSRVTRLCGHLPLRIRLAGGQLRRHPAWSVGDLASRLSDLGSDDPDMAAEFDLSYRYLTAEQQQLFRQLALHPGDSFPRYAAVAMSGGGSPAKTEHALEVLLDHHLVEEPVPGRYTFHSLLRDYASGLADTVDSEQDRRLAMGRLLDYYLSLADRAHRIVNPFGRQVTIPDSINSLVLPSPRSRHECMELLEAEKSSLLAVAHYASTQGLGRYVGLFARLLGGFLDTWGDWADAVDLHRRAIDAWRTAGDPSGEAAALTDLGFVLCRTGQHAQAADHVLNALAIARVASDKSAEAAALDTAGIIHACSARYEEALASHDQALVLWRDVGDRHGEADALSRGVMPAARLGRHSHALRRAESALAAYREVGDRHGETNVLNNIGGLLQDDGRHEEALASYERAKVGFTQIGDRQGEAIALNNIGEIHRLSGREDQALKDYRAALSIFQDIGDRGSVAQALNGMAAAYVGAGHNDSALDCYEKALVLAIELGERHAQGVSHQGIGGINLTMGRCLSAVNDYQVALKLSQEVADPVQEAQALYGLGCAVSRTQGASAAQEYWRAALALFEVADRPEAEEVRILLAVPPGDTQAAPVRRTC